MKYFRAKRVVTEFTTLNFNAYDNEYYIYDSDDVYDYIGVNIDNSGSLLAQQCAEIEAEELSYEVIKPILESCKKMRDYDLIIETGIGKKYTVGREFKMRDLPEDDPERIEYEAYKESVKAPIRLMKIENGLMKLRQL